MVTLINVVGVSSKIDTFRFLLLLYLTLLEKVKQSILSMVWRAGSIGTLHSQLGREFSNKRINIPK